QMFTFEVEYCHVTNAKLQTAAKGAVANQKTAAKAALVHTCPVCRVSSSHDLKTFKQHFESKHPKSQMVDKQA
uniref:Uncharacterized protein n=1 Tax=Oncorhynchus tshawytscha TaxID=74940 RepID=A0AAZ3SRE4_ONCTS